MGSSVDRTGKRYGMLIAIEPVKADESRSISWLCRCDCGREKIIRGSNLTGGGSQSCGCTIRTQGGLCTSPEYLALQGARSRCGNPNDPGYENYGGRGIEVCERWLGKEGFANFLEDMGRKPFSEYSLDRIDVNGDYEPGNCRWTTDTIQNRNRRFNVNLTHEGRTMTIAEWTRELGLGSGTIAQRLKLGWDIEEALTTPARKKSKRWGNR